MEKAQTFLAQHLWIRVLMVLLLTYVAAIVARWVLKRIVTPLVKRTRTTVDDVIIRSISSILFYIVILLGAKIALEQFESPSPIAANLLNTFFILIICIILLRIIGNFAEYWMSQWRHRTQTTADERLLPFLQKIIKTVVIVLSVIFVFSAWDVDISPLLATAGIAGLAIGLAVKDSLGNILGGLQLVMDRTFKVGDKVELESGELGVILDIGLRSTKLKTYDHEVIFIPNGYLANSKIKNFTQPDFSIRVNVEFGVEYGSDLQRVKTVVADALTEMPEVLNEPEPAAQFLRMSDFSLDFIARAWVEDYSSAYSTWLSMNETIYDALNRAGISIPFPTRTIISKTKE